MNAKQVACNEARSSWEEHVGMRDNIRKGDFEHSNEEPNGKSSYEEENQLPMFGRKGDDENLNEKEKNINEEEDIGRRKCRTKSPIDKYNEEVRGWTYSLYLSIGLFVLHLRLPIFPSSLMFFSFSFKFSASPFLPYIGNLFSPSSLLFPFYSLFECSKSLFLILSRIRTFSSSLLLASLHAPSF